MPRELTERTRCRLDIQGFERVDTERLAAVAPWLRLAFGLSTLVAGIGTLLASPPILWALVPIAALGALLPLHPFDLLYSYGIRFVTKTPPLPRRGAPSRFASGLGTVWLLATIWAFETERAMLGYVLGGLLTAVGGLVSTTDICIPSLIYRSLFGFPRRADGANELGA